MRFSERCTPTSRKRPAAQHAVAERERERSQTRPTRLTTVSQSRWQKRAISTTESTECHEEPSPCTNGELHSARKLHAGSTRRASSTPAPPSSTPSLRAPPDPPSRTRGSALAPVARRAAAALSACALATLADTIAANCCCGGSSCCCCCSCGASDGGAAASFGSTRRRRAGGSACHCQGERHPSQYEHLPQSAALSNSAVSAAACSRAQRMCIAQMKVEPVDASTVLCLVVWYHACAYLRTLGGQVRVGIR